MLVMKKSSVKNKENTELNLEEKLIYNILFTSKSDYEITLELYCINETKSSFRDKIRNIIKKGNKSITEDRIINTENKTVWRIIIKENVMV